MFGGSSGDGLSSEPSPEPDLAATTASATLGGAVAGVVVVGVGVGVVRIVVGVVVVVRVVTRCGVRFGAVLAAVGSVLLATATPTPATPATPPAVGRAIALLVVVAVALAVAVALEVVLVVGIRGVLGSSRTGDSLNRLRRDEQRHVLGPLDGRGFQHRPRLGFIRVAGGAHLNLDGRRRDRRGRVGQQVANADRVDAFHGGVRAADPAVELSQCVEYLAAGRPQRPRQGVNPEPIWQLLVLRRVSWNL